MPLGSCQGRLDAVFAPSASGGDKHALTSPGSDASIYSPGGTSWVGVLSRSCIVSDTPTLMAQPVDFRSGLQFLPPGSTGCSWRMSPEEISCHPVGRHILLLSPLWVLKSLDYNARLPNRKQLDPYQSITL